MEDVTTHETTCVFLFVIFFIFYFYSVSEIGYVRYPVLILKLTGRETKDLRTHSSSLSPKKMHLCVKKFQNYFFSPKGRQLKRFSRGKEENSDEMVTRLLCVFLPLLFTGFRQKCRVGACGHADFTDLGLNVTDNMRYEMFINDYVA